MMPLTMTKAGETVTIRRISGKDEVRLPGELADTLRAGLRAYERKIAGYTAPEAVLTGLETRTSSPVRLKREETLESAQLAGLYPCGEGAGYAGGIMSAAVDGLRVARAIIGRYAPAEG